MVEAWRQSQEKVKALEEEVKERQEEAKRASEARESRKKSPGALGPCSQNAEEGPCIRRGCAWYIPNPLASSIVGKVSSSRGNPRCMSQEEFQKKWWITSGKATDAQQRKRETVEQLEKARQDMAAKDHEVQVARLQCNLQTKQACVAEAHCGWLEAATRKCKTKAEWKRQASRVVSSLNVRGPSREEMCQAGGGTWTKGSVTGYLGGGECT